MGIVKKFKFDKGDLLDESILEFLDKELTDCEQGKLPSMRKNWLVTIIIEDRDQGEDILPLEKDRDEPEDPKSIDLRDEQEEMLLA